MDVLSTMKDRRSVRAFLDKPVAKEKIEQIIEAARFAPSGVNIQPWKVAVVTGIKRQAICEAFISAFRSGQKMNPDFQYYPLQWREPYKSRRFKCGMALYKALGIERDDKARRKEQWELNYNFFHAPVGMFIYLDDYLEKGSWMDMGMFLQNLMLAARGVGLETCPQAAMAEYPDIVREQLNLVGQHIVCGLALGYADWDHPVNQYRTERESVDTLTTWHWE